MNSEPRTKFTKNLTIRGQLNKVQIEALHSCVNIICKSLSLISQGNLLSALNNLNKLNLLSICTGILGIFDILQFEISSLMNWIFFLV